MSEPQAAPVLQIVATDLSPVFALLTLLVTTFGAVILAWIAYKQALVVKALNENTTITNLTHETTNSKMDLLLKTIEDAALARGKLLGPDRRDPSGGG